MYETYAWPWVEQQVAWTAAVWSHEQGRRAPEGRQYDRREQRQREKAYDAALRETEREAKRAPLTRADRLGTQERVTASFARFSAAALGLEPDAIELLTGEFLPVGTQLAEWARSFDPELSMADITQACRNAWTACGMQPLLGVRVGLTPSILGYSLLYPYSDNYLDRPELAVSEKLRFSKRFHDRLRGDPVAACDAREAAVWRLVELIEGQYPRASFPAVYSCLLAIHRAQEESVSQLAVPVDRNEEAILRTSCAKGGSSVLADACLARGWLSGEESRFSFAWGVLLQLGDDLQDVHDDLARGSATIFTRAVRIGQPLDARTMQLLHFSERVGDLMDGLPNGSPMLKELLRMSWRSLIVAAVAYAHEFFTRGFLEEAERCSPFRFAFLRERQQRLAGRQGLYATLFDAFLEEQDMEIEAEQHIGKKAEQVIEQAPCSAAPESPQPAATTAL